MPQEKSQSPEGIAGASNRTRLLFLRFHIQQGE